MIKIPEEFLKEEERCDYLVTAKMKKVWATHLDLLHELKRVCDKYGLTYYALYGTLIGAIRHKGFIPWDDDIDLIMMRDDYNKLSQVAKDEFKHPYFFQDVYSDGFARGFARLRNSETTAITRTYLKHDINQGIFIDIFIADAIPDDESIRNKWFKNVSSIYRVINGMFFEEEWRVLSLPKRVLLKLCKKTIPLHRIARIYDRLCSKYNAENDTEYIGLVSYKGGRKVGLWQRKWFQHGMDSPFEFTTIHIPEGYHEFLTKVYRDYMVMKRTPTSHGKTIYDTETPYKVYLKEHSQEEIEQMLYNL